MGIWYHAEKSMYEVDLEKRLPREEALKAGYVEVDETPRSDAELNAAYKADIDAAADAMRRKYATDISFQQKAYELKAADAEAFMALAAPRPAEATGYPWLAIRLEALRAANPAATATDAATEILATRNAWQDSLLLESERLRDTGKLRVAAATTPAAKRAVRDEIVAALRAL